MVGDARPTSPPGATPAQDGDPFGGLRPGTQVGKYEIVEMLGQGGFGITYRARDTQLRRDVAVKEYLPTSFAMRQGSTTVLPRSTHVAEDFRWGRERFLDEARTLATLEDAPGIVNVYDFMEANGTAYMVMALVRGETLDARLKRERRLQQPAIEQILYPLLDGLERVHEAGFLHRDIKPANILLDASGRPTLIDFGASRIALQGRTQALTAVYTPGYAAFEQSTSAKQGPWTDIYALAATLYQCITGAPPPAASDRMIDDQLVPAAEAGKGRYAPSLLAAIDAGLRLKAADRPQTIGDWRRVLSGQGARDGASLGEPTRGMDEPATRRVDEPAPRRRAPAMWVAAGAVVLALAGGGAWLALRPGPETPEEALHRIEAEAQRQMAVAQKLRQEEEARQRAAAEARRRAGEEAARRAAAEKEAAEAEARRQAEQEVARRAAEEKAAAEGRRKAEEEAARKAAADKEAAEAVARRQAEQAAAARAEAEADRLRREEVIRREAEERVRAEYEARRKAEEDVAAREREQAEARRKTEEEARLASEEKARAEAEARRQAEGVESALHLSEPDRRRVQVALSALGHSTQGTDGVFGPRTRQMIAAWQRSQGTPDTGFLTAAQLVSLRQQAAPAIARFDEEQKKAEDDKRKAEDEVRRKADEEARKRAEAEKSQAAAPAVAAAAPAPAGSLAAFDGTYRGEHCSAPRDKPVSCGPAVLVVQNGIGNYSWPVRRCSGNGTVMFKIETSGKLAGTSSGYDSSCLPGTGRIWGQISGGQVKIQSGGNLRATFTKQ